MYYLKISKKLYNKLNTFSSEELDEILLYALDRKEFIQVVKKMMKSSIREKSSKSTIKKINKEKITSGTSDMLSSALSDFTFE